MRFQQGGDALYFISIEVNIRIMRTFVAVRQILPRTPVEGEVNLQHTFEEVLADANDRDEMMERRIDVLKAPLTCFKRKCSLTSQSEKPKTSI